VLLSGDCLIQLFPHYTKSAWYNPIDVPVFTEILHSRQPAPQEHNEPGADTE